MEAHQQVSDEDTVGGSTGFAEAALRLHIQGLMRLSADPRNF